MQQSGYLLGIQPYRTQFRDFFSLTPKNQNFSASAIGEAPMIEY